MTQEDVDAYERKREEHNRKIRAENEARRIAFEAKRVADEKNPALWQGVRGPHEPMWSEASRWRREHARHLRAVA